MGWLLQWDGFCNGMGMQWDGFCCLIQRNLKATTKQGRPAAKHNTCTHRRSHKLTPSSMHTPAQVWHDCAPAGFQPAVLLCCARFGPCQQGALSSCTCPRHPCGCGHYEGVCVFVSVGMARVSKEHLAAALALDIHVAVVITKVCVCTSVALDLSLLGVHGLHES